MAKGDIWDVEFWKAALTRAIRTFAEAMLAAIGTRAVGLTEVDWVGAASIGATAAICSVLLAIATGVPEHEGGDGNDGGNGPTLSRDVAMAVLAGLAIGAACVMGTPTMAQAKTSDGYWEGVDLSHWDGGLNLEAFADDCNLDFSIIKVGGNEDSIGGRYRDTEFVNFYRQSQNAGLHTGAYYYATTTDIDEAREDADHCADLLDGYGVALDMPVFYDIEDPGQTYLSQRELTDVCIAFCERITERGYRAGIYTSGSWWQGEVFAEELNKYSDWVAWWGRDSWPEIEGIYSGLWQVGGISWGHNTYWDPDAGDFHDYDLCRIAYWDDAPTPKPDPQPQPEPEPEPEPADALDVDGYGGTLTVDELQRQLGTPRDGWITGQWEGNADFTWAIWAQEFDEGGSACVEALQRIVGATPDGYWGYDTSACTQKWLEMHGYDVGEAGVDGYFGRDSVRALQRALNDEVFASAEPAPEPEPAPVPEGQGTVEDVMNVAYGELGYYAPDDPEPGSKYGRWMASITGEDWMAGPSWEVWWCCMYVSWVLDHANVQMDGAPSANTNELYPNGGYRYEVNPYDVARGDIVIYDWNWDGYTDHISFATGSYDGYGFPTIEGNVGNAVVEYYRGMGNVAHVLRPDYA